MREAVAEDLHRRLGAEVSPDLIMIVPGGKVTMFMAIEMFGEKGVDVVYPDPGFPIYRSMIEFTGARPIPVPMREANGFAFSAEEALNLMTPETQLVILNSPANPTGGVTPKEEIDKLVVGLARFPKAAIMSDEIYGQLTYDGLAYQTLLAYPEIRDRLILLDGWSKTYAMTGWRLGYSVWPKAWRDVARKLAVNSYSCVNASAQFAGIAALKGPQELGRLHAGGVRSATQGGDCEPQSPARRERRDTERRVLRVSQTFPARAGKPSRLLRRCCRMRAWPQSAVRTSACMARGTCGSPTPTRLENIERALEASGIIRAAPRARRRACDPLFMSFKMIKVIMQLLVFAAAAIAFSTFARAQAASPSQADCDPAKIGAESLPSA